jgi:chromosome segregation ATPase
MLFQVHLREEVTKEQDIQKLGRTIQEELGSLGEEVKASSSGLEAALSQLEQYQGTISSLRQSILACEGELRTVSSPAYTARDRDRALAEQSVRILAPHWLSC